MILGKHTKIQKYILQKFKIITKTNLQKFAGSSYWIHILPYHDIWYQRYIYVTQTLMIQCLPSISLAFPINVSPLTARLLPTLPWIRHLRVWWTCCSTTPIIIVLHHHHHHPWKVVFMNKTFQIMWRCLLAIVLMTAKLAPHKITIPEIHGRQYHASYFVQIGLYKFEKPDFVVGNTGALHQTDILLWQPWELGFGIFDIWCWCLISPCIHFYIQVVHRLSLKSHAKGRMGQYFLIYSIKQKWEVNLCI